MRVRMQNSNDAAVMGAVRTYDGRSEALLMMTTLDKELSKALISVFTIQDAQDVDPETELPWREPDVGDCVIGNEGIVITIEGSGVSFMGMRYEVTWGRTNPRWHAYAERQGRVWLGLVGPADYSRLFEGDESERLPRMRILKLEVAP